MKLRTRGAATHLAAEISRWQESHAQSELFPNRFVRHLDDASHRNLAQESRTGTSHKTSRATPTSALFANNFRSSV
ncbi:MAG: hypothetical protein RL591_2353 [Planctomycetota bacterium]